MGHDSEYIIIYLNLYQLHLNIDHNLHISFLLFYNSISIYNAPLRLLLNHILLFSKITTLQKIYSTYNYTIFKLLNLKATSDTIYFIFAS